MQRLNTHHLCVRYAQPLTNHFPCFDGNQRHGIQTDTRYRRGALLSVDGNALVCSALPARQPAVALLPAYPAWRINIPQIPSCATSKAWVWLPERTRGGEATLGARPAEQTVSRPGSIANGMEASGTTGGMAAPMQLRRSPRLTGTKRQNAAS